MKKFILIVIGSIAIALGVLGMFLPMLPTTPLLLLAAACYMRASDRLYLWLIGNKYLGSYIKNYQENKGMVKKDKLITIGTLWVGIGISVFIVPLGWIKILLLVIALLVSRYILSLKTLDRENHA